MQFTRVASVALIGVLAGCGGGTEAKKDEGKKEEVKAAEPKKDDAKPAEPKKEDVKPADVKAADVKPAEPAAGGGEWGVKACDDYMKTVSDCKTFKKDSPVFTGITDKWKKLKEEGKADELEKGCTKAAELFKCPAK